MQSTEPRGYNVKKVTDLSHLDKHELLEVMSKVLNKLNIDVWMGETPDYTEIILTDRKPTCPKQL